MGSIVDNRILVDDAESTQYDDLTGSAAGTLDTEIFIENATSQSYYTTTTRDGLLHDAGSAQDWSNNVFYIWFQCQVAGLLDTKDNGGVAVRFCGATVTDFFEVYIEGSDTYSGGWKMLVIDIEEARRLATSASPLQGATGGTPPATNAIRYVGVTTITSATMPRKVDNTFMDAIWRLPNTEPGIIVIGENSSVSPAVPWTMADILNAADVADASKAWGTVLFKDGVYTINTPIQFGNNGSPAAGENHDFEDSNVVIAWENNIVLDGFYGFTIVGDPTNNQRFVAGISGSAGQGFTVVTDPSGPRWFIDATDADIDIAGFYGCSFSHTTTIDIDNTLVDMYDTLLIDGQRLWHARVNSPLGGADFQRNVIINASPIPGEGSPLVTESPQNVAYIHTANPAKIQDCTFNYFTGHALQLLEPGEFNFIGNQFNHAWISGGSPSGEQTLDAAIYNPTGDLITLNVTDGDTPTIFDEAGAVGSPERPFVDLQFAEGYNAASGSSISSSWTISSPVIQTGWGIFVITSYAGNNGPGTCATSTGVPLRLHNTFYDSNTNRTMSIFYLAEYMGAPTGVVTYTLPSASTNRGIWVWGVDPRGGYITIADSSITAQSAPGTGTDAITTDPLDIAGDFGILLGLTTSDTATSFGTGGTGSTGDGTAWSNTAHAEDYDDINGPVSQAVEFTTLNGGADYITGGIAVHTVHSLTTINNNVLVTITGLQPGTEVRVYPRESPINTTEIAGVESVGSPTEFSFSAPAGSVVDIVIFHIDYVLPPANRIEGFTIPATATSFPVSQILDRNYFNP